MLITIVLGVVGEMCEGRNINRLITPFGLEYCAKVYFIMKYLQLRFVEY